MTITLIAVLVLSASLVVIAVGELGRPAPTVTLSRAKPTAANTVIVIKRKRGNRS